MELFLLDFVEWWKSVDFSVGKSGVTPPGSTGVIVTSSA
jgi:hypothetical protein